MIVGAFFSSKPDPQRPQVWYTATDLDNYTYLWRTTAHALGLPVVIITDAVEAHRSALENDLCSFAEHTPKDWSTNDERIIAFANFLRNDDCKNVFFTDTGDVLFKKNPFQLISEEHPLCVGTDVPGASKVRDNSWLIHKLFLLNQQLDAEDRFIEDGLLSQVLGNHRGAASRSLFWRLVRRFVPAIRGFLSRDPSSIWEAKPANAGVIGGKRESVAPLIEEMAQIIQKLEKGQDLNLNMAVLNYVIWRNRLTPFSGPPLTNEFRSYSSIGPEAIIHK